MGKMLSKNAKGEYRLWSTISDGWLTDWLSAEDMKAELVWNHKADYRRTTIELLWTFPHGYYDKETYQMIDNRKALIEFNEWHLKALKSDDYYQLLDDKYKELIAKNESR